MPTRPALPPFKTFKSPGGRTFTVAPGERLTRWKGDREWQDNFPVLLDGERAGTIILGFHYDRPPAAPRWRGSLREISSKLMFDSEAQRRGIGYDFGPCTSARDCARSFGRGADQVLDYLAEKAARSGAGGGGATSRARGSRPARTKGVFRSDRSEAEEEGEWENADQGRIVFDRVTRLGTRR